MRIFLLALVCLLTVSSSDGQAGKNIYGRIEVEFTKEKHPKRIYAKADIKDPFPGGDSTWVRSLEIYLNQSTKIGKKIKKGKYMVSVAFIVDKQGDISDVKCLNDPGFGMGGEVVRFIKKTGQKWRPAGQPVKEYRTPGS